MSDLDFTKDIAALASTDNTDYSISTKTDLEHEQAGIHLPSTSLDTDQSDLQVVGNYGGGKVPLIISGHWVMNKVQD